MDKLSNILAALIVIPLLILSIIVLIDNVGPPEDWDTDWGIPARGEGDPRLNTLFVLCLGAFGALVVIGKAIG